MVPKLQSVPSILIVIPHNPIWVGSEESILEHPAFYRKLLLFYDVFKHIFVIRGGNRSCCLIKFIKTTNGKQLRIGDTSIKYRNITSYSIEFIVTFMTILLRLKKRVPNIRLFLLSFDHSHLFSIFTKLISRLFRIYVISFYVITPLNFKERITYFVSKICDHISLTNHPLIAKKLGLRNCFIIPNIPDKKFFESVDAKHRNKKEILMVSRLSWEKRVDIAVAIIAKLKETIPDVKLYIVGDGPLRPLLENIAQKYGILNKNIFFLGYNPLDTVLYLMKKCGTLIHTSLHEYFPNIIVEAMACNLPVLVPKTETYHWIVGRSLLRSTKTSENAKIVEKLLTDEDFYLKQVQIQKKRLEYLLRMYHIQVETLKDHILKSNRRCLVCL